MWEHGRGGFGCVIRDTTRAWIIGCTNRMDVMSVFHVELVDILRGLKLAWEYGYHWVCCETNCMEAFCDIQSLTVPV